MDSEANKHVAEALGKLGVKVIHNNAGKALQALMPEDEIHAAFLRREDIACLSAQMQAEKWAAYQQGLSNFFKAMANVPLYGRI
jgi:hypothetical protein